MDSKQIRGSEKLMAAWKARALTEESIGEIADALDKSPAKVENANVVGGQSATGVQLSLVYSGDDVPWCGNDILFWLRWHQRYGGVLRPPKIIINGIPFPDLVRLTLDFGQVHQESPVIPEIQGALDAGTFGGQ